MNKELIKKSYTNEQLRFMLTELQAIIMRHSEKIAQHRKQQEELVKEADIIAEVLGERREDLT